MLDRPLINDSPELGAGSVHQWCFGRYFDRLLCRAYLQSRIEHDHAVNFDRHILLHTFLESGLLKLGRVTAGRDFQEAVVAAGIRLGLANAAGCFIDQAH